MGTINQIAERGRLQLARYFERPCQVLTPLWKSTACKLTAKTKTTGEQPQVRQGDGASIAEPGASWRWRTTSTHSALNLSALVLAMVNEQGYCCLLRPAYY